ncbi:MAG: GIY-YIG nuclease family protein [Rudaea sp.]
MSSGLYLVQLLNELPISVNANDSRRPNCLKVDRRHCKVGKAKRLAGRERNYHDVFTEANVVFTAVVEVEDIATAEREVLARLKRFRIRGGQANRLHEWLENISGNEVIRNVFEALREAHIPFKPLIAEP